MSENYTIIDVRAPLEYAEGHIPGAISLPIFDDKERAVVGTIYKHRGKTEAVVKGLEFVGPKMAQFANKARELAKDNKILIHCWRGGMRSQSMAWLFEKVDVECYLLKGGYKAYRNFLLDEISSIDSVVVLSGDTGAGKTDILKAMRDNGVQVIDLEGLANHRGSVFGGIGQPQQPSTQQFQNMLLKEILKCDKTEPIWVEGESKAIGRVFIPDPFWISMNSAPIIEIDVPQSFRIKRLVRDYGHLESDDMVRAIGAIKKRLGDKRHQEIVDIFLEGGIAKVAELLLDYYDRAYKHGRNKANKKHYTLKIIEDDFCKNAVDIVDFYSTLFNNKEQ